MDLTDINFNYFEIDVNENFLSLLWILASVYLFSHKKKLKNDICY
jgi:hypothetical protein